MENIRFDRVQAAHVTVPVVQLNFDEEETVCG